ncbi:MAG: DoxX family protein [Rhizobiaceae bacterium]|nr:DoxX family protein [Rhizobiaceae bacterium]
MSNNVVLLIARILLSVMFIMAGFSKFGSIEGISGYIGSVGLPAPTLLAWLSGIWEVVAGVAVLVGFQTRIAALALALFCVLTAVFFHNNLADQMQMSIFFKNFALVGGFLALYAAGPGSISIDGRRASA